MYQLSDICARLVGYHYLVLRRSDTRYCVALAGDASATRYEGGIVYVLPSSALQMDAVCDGDACLFVIEDCKRELSELCANVVLFGGSTDAQGLLRDVREILQLSLRLDHAEREMIGAIQKVDSMERLVNTAHAYLRNPILIRDMAFRVLVVREREEILTFKGNTLQAMTREGYAQPHFIADPEISHRQRLIRDARRPLLFGVTGERRIMGEIYIDNTPVAHLIVYERHHLFTDVDLELAHIFVKMLSVEFQKSARFHVDNSPCEAFLNDVLDGKLEEKKIEELAAGFLWRLRGFYCVAVLALHIADEHDLIRSYSKQAIYNSAVGDLTKNFPDTRVTYYKGNCILFFSLPSLSAIREARERLLQMLLANAPIQVGMSDVFTEMFRAGSYYAQASAVLEFGRKMAPAENLYCFDDHYYDFLFANLPADCLRQFCIMQAWTALHYDQQNGTTLCESMLVFLQEGQSNAASAKKLGIHRNTVSYRVNRFCEMTEFDLHDGDMTTRLYFSLLILRRLKAFPTLFSHRKHDTIPSALHYA